MKNEYYYYSFYQKEYEDPLTKELMGHRNHYVLTDKGWRLFSNKKLSYVPGGRKVLTKGNDLVLSSYDELRKQFYLTDNQEDKEITEEEWLKIEHEHVYGDSTIPPELEGRIWELAYWGRLDPKKYFPEMFKISMPERIDYSMLSEELAEDSWQAIRRLQIRKKYGPLIQEILESKKNFDCVFSKSLWETKTKRIILDVISNEQPVIVDLAKWVHYILAKKNLLPSKKKTKQIKKTTSDLRDCKFPKVTRHK